MQQNKLRGSLRRFGMLAVLLSLWQGALARAQTPADKKADTTDEEKIRRILADIRQRAHSPADESKKNAADQASSQINDIAGRLAADRRMQLNRQRSFNDVLGSVDRSALPPGDDIAYPKDWKEKSQARASSQVKMTAKEKAIFRALDTSMTLKLKNARFEEVIDYLWDKTGVNILLDRAALAEAGVTYDSPVSIDVKNVTMRTVLSLVLGNLGLTYAIRNEAIQVVTPGMARQMMVTRTYYIRDLLPADWGFFSAVQAAQLIELIQLTVEPQSWKVNGGEGTIAYDPITRALVVKQSAEFHSVLSSGAR